ncbi:MAG: hypothetical protein EPO68_09540, partial [Planctomycetota bacterium]
MTHALRLAVLLALAIPTTRADAQDDAAQHGWRMRVAGKGGSVESVVPAFAGVGAPVDASASAVLELSRSGRYRFALEASSGSGLLQIDAIDG